LGKPAVRRTAGVCGFLKSGSRRRFHWDKLGAMPKAALTADEHAKNNLPDILARWQERDGSERKRRVGNYFDA
jgi:hypothetical protein